MTSYSNNITFFKQWFHYKRTDYEELMSWNKYSYKKKKFEVTRKKKNERFKSDDNFTLNLNLTFNLRVKEQNTLQT